MTSQVNGALGWDHVSGTGGRRGTSLAPGRGGVRKAVQAPAGAEAYDPDFFATITRLAVSSARVVVPLVNSLFVADSVIDIGCGTGGWLREFQEHGVQHILGLDGEYVDRGRLLIDAACFRAVDLSGPLDVGGQYDLAVCLEVAEHVPAASAPSLVRTLTKAAPVVLFSAAIPGQGGTNHINEQWPWYWKELFAAQGFRRLDPIRRKIWHDNRVARFYRQNLVLYATDEAITRWRPLQREAKLAADNSLELVDTDVLVQLLLKLQRYQSLRGIASQVPLVAWQAIQRRLRRLRPAPTERRA